MQHFALTRKFATACAAFAMALSCGAMGVASTANAADATPVYSPVEASDAARNYAVNLPEGSGEAQIKAAVAEAEKMGDVVALAQYPQFGTFFVQAKSKSFAKDYAEKATADGIAIDSVGTTRQARVTGDEDVVDKDSDKGGASTFSLNRMDANSQFAKEESLQNDPYTTADKAWGVLALGADKAAETLKAKGVSLAPVTVGVIDSGVDYRHADFKNTDGTSQIDDSLSVDCSTNGIATQATKANGDKPWMPTASSHGTHVAGTIAAASNGIGVDGVAPTVKIAAIKAMNDGGFLYPEYVTCGFAWSADKGIDVTNNSYYSDPWEYWVPSDPTQTAGYEAVRRAVAYATSKGVTNVAAAGNSDQNLDDPSPDNGSPNDVANDPDGKTIIKNRDVKNGIDIPASLPGVVTVSAVGEAVQGELGSYTRASFSNYGKNSIDVAAPGVRIASTVDPDLDGGDYAYYSGTSMASPHAAGVAALIKGVHPDYTPAQVLDLMKKQAKENYGQLADPSKDAGKEYRGAGLVNAYSVVTEDQPEPNVSASAVEYSTDGGKTWNPLENATVKGKATIRATATGAVQALKIETAGQSKTVKAEKKTYGNTLTAGVDVDFGTVAAGKQTAVITATDLDGKTTAPLSVSYAAAADAADTTAPVLSGVDPVTVKLNAAFDPMAGVKAVDDVDGDVTAQVKVSGTVDTSKAGKTTLTYTVADKAGNTAKAERVVTVAAGGSDKDESAAAGSANAAKPALSNTGSTVAGIAGVALALAAVATALVVRRRRA